MMTVTRRYLLQATHELEGIEPMHGHHMYVEITGRDTTPSELDQEYYDRVQNRLQGKNLASVLEEPTGESLVQWIHGELLRSKLKTRVVAVHVQETEKNRFTSSLSESRYV